jgi:hypothetical protein
MSSSMISSRAHPTAQCLPLRKILRRLDPTRAHGAIVVSLRSTHEVFAAAQMLSPDGNSYMLYFAAKKSSLSLQLFCLLKILLR